MKYLKIITTISILLTFAALSTKAQSVIFEYDAAGNMIKRMTGQTCLGNLTIPANFSNNKVLDVYTKRSGKITTASAANVNKKVDVIVRKEERVEFRGDNIELKPGFKVENNAIFKAVIDPCKQ